MESRTDDNSCNVNNDNNRHFNRKILKPNRNLFIKPVYVTRTEGGDINNPQTQFMNYMKSIFPNDKLETVKDSCTQTSKTIIELAKLDGHGTISPDSLNASPRRMVPNSYESEIQNLNQTTSLNFKNFQFQPNLYTYNPNHTNLAQNNEYQISNPQNEVFKPVYNLRKCNENNVSQKRNDSMTKDINTEVINEKCNYFLSETDIYAREELKKRVEPPPFIRKIHKPINKYSIYNDNDCSTITEESVNLDSCMSKINEMDEAINISNNSNEYIITDTSRNQCIRPQNIPDMNIQNDININRNEFVKYMVNEKQCETIKKQYGKLTPSSIVINVMDKKQKSPQNFKKSSLIDQFLTKTQNRKKTDVPFKTLSTYNCQRECRPETKNPLISRSYVEPRVASFYKELPHTSIQNTNENRNMYLKAEKEDHLHQQSLYVKQVPKLDLDATSDSNLSELKVNSPNPSYFGKRSNSFMSPTLASARKSLYHDVQSIRNLMGATRRGRSFSPKYRMQNQNIPIDDAGIPYIDQVGDYGVDATLICDEIKEEYNGNTNLKVQESASSLQASISSSDNQMYLLLTHMKSTDWNTSLKGLAELTEFARSAADPDVLIPYMTIINQKLLHLLRSPRSHVCRTACQVAGHLFETMKDTRRPEFDDIVNVLLYKTADANKFIRQDANLSLDCMVTHIPTFHAIRSLSSKGPNHKNSLVRTATIRLLICAVVIAGPKELLGITSNENTRKRVIQCLVLFLQDKNVDTRRYAERLYKILHKEDNFENCLRKYLYKEELEVFKNRTLKFLKRTFK